MHSLSRTDFRLSSVRAPKDSGSVHEGWSCLRPCPLALVKARSGAWLCPSWRQECGGVSTRCCRPTCLSHWPVSLLPMFQCENTVHGRSSGRGGWNWAQVRFCSGPRTDCGTSRLALHTPCTPHPHAFPNEAGPLSLGLAIPALPHWASSGQGLSLAWSQGFHLSREFTQGKMQPV